MLFFSLIIASQYNYRLDRTYLNYKNENSLPMQYFSLLASVKQEIFQEKFTDEQVKFLALKLIDYEMKIDDELRTTIFGTRKCKEQLLLLKSLAYRHYLAISVKRLINIVNVNFPIRKYTCSRYVLKPGEFEKMLLIQLNDPYYY